MVINVDILTGAIVSSAGTPYYGNSQPSFQLTVRGSEPVLLILWSNGAPTLLPVGSLIAVGFKPIAKYDEDFTLSVTAFTAPTTAATGYVATLDTNTTEAIVILDPNNADGSTPDADEPDYEYLMGQVAWLIPGAASYRRSQPFAAQLFNAIIRGDEAVPTSANPAYPSAATVTTAVAQAVAATAALAALGFVHPVANNAAKLALTALPIPGIQVSGGDADGPYTFYSTGPGGYPIYTLLGLNTATAVGGIMSHQSSGGWIITSVLTGATVYSSSDNVATPDLCTTWKNASNAVVALSVTTTTVPPVAAGHYALVQGEANRLERFLGPVAGAAGAGLRLTGAGFSTENNAYTLVAPNNYQNVDTGDGSNIVLSVDDQNNPAWVISDGGATVHYYGTPTTYPWEAVWSVAASSFQPGPAPVPTVTRNDVACDANWLVERNTILATVGNSTANDFTINSETVPSGSQTQLWLDPTSIRYGGESGEIYIQYFVDAATELALLIADGNANGLILGGACQFSLPTLVQDRGQYYLGLNQSGY